MRRSCLNVHSRNDFQVCVREFVRTKIQIRVGCGCLNRVRTTLWNMHSTIVQYMPHTFRWGVEKSPRASQQFTTCGNEATSCATRRPRWPMMMSATPSRKQRPSKGRRLSVCHYSSTCTRFSQSPKVRRPETFSSSFSSC